MIYVFDEIFSQIFVVEKEKVVLLRPQN